MTPFLDIKDKTALVTGGGSGICLELTRKLLQGGCNVVIADLQVRPEAEELIRKSNGKVVYQKTDVTDWKQLQAAFDVAMKEFGALHIVVPGAGVFEPEWSNFWNYNTPSNSRDTSKSSYAIFDINISHPIRSTQLAIDYFKRQSLPQGCVCLIASIAAQMTLLPVPLYCASKHAISAFTRSMALLEPSLGIRVNAVAPGVVKTPLWPQDRLEWVDEEKDSWVTTGQVADVMLELMTKGENVGGTVLEVLAEKVRKVDLLNDPGPSGPGTTLEHIGKGFEGVFPMIEKNFGK